MADIKTRDVRHRGGDPVGVSAVLAHEREEFRLADCCGGMSLRGSGGADRCVAAAVRRPDRLFGGWDLSHRCHLADRQGRFRRPETKRPSTGAELYGSWTGFVKNSGFPP